MAGFTLLLLQSFFYPLKTADVMQMAAKSGTQMRVEEEDISCLQFMCAVGGFVHAVTLLQQLEELLDRDAGVWRTSQRKDLPHQNAKRPPERKTPLLVRTNFGFAE